MHPSEFAGLFRHYGPFAVNTVLYNYGEPLLNKYLPELIKTANSYAVSSDFSTNGSVRFDVERFVLAGPDRVILSIDGVTQETYSRFRKGGDLMLVLDNVRRLVECKRKHGLNRPILGWRFFTFEHNVHEVDTAIQMAEEIGVDYIVIATPFDVSQDDPGVRVAECDRKGRYDFKIPEQRRKSPERIRKFLSEHEEVERFFEEDWSARMVVNDVDETANSRSATCVWLYYNMTLDAIGRVLPCCKAPSVKKNLVFGHMIPDNPDLYNLSSFVSSRRSFADRKAYDSWATDADHLPYCASCTREPGLTYGTENGIRDLKELDFRGACLSRDSGFWRDFGCWV